jgi:hypothetical protein
LDRAGFLSPILNFIIRIESVFGGRLQIWSRNRFYHPAGPQALGARLDASGGSVFLVTDNLKIRIPATFGLVVGVRDIVPDMGVFSANITLSGHL